MKKIGAKNKVYLAYGSNLNLEQMEYRCPYAVPLGTAVLTGYRLLFRGGKNSAVATVEPEAGCSVPVLLWEITPRDEQALDIYEGWPRLYRKETVTVDFEGKPMEVMIYIMNVGYEMDLPSSRYLDTICEGYVSAGFPADALKEAVAFSANGGKQKKRGDCLLCANSMSVEDQFEYGADRLFCVIRQDYVEENGYCEKYN